MNRCSTRFFTLPVLAAGLALLLAAAGAPQPAQAQVQRLLPAKAVRGTIHFESPPHVVVDGKPDRLAPGVRVRDPHNRIALTGALRGKTVEARYLRDAAGVIREVWILTPAELAREGGTGSFGRVEPGDPHYRN